MNVFFHCNFLQLNYCFFSRQVAIPSNWRCKITKKIPFPQIFLHSLLSQIFFLTFAKIFQHHESRFPQADNSDNSDNDDNDDNADNADNAENPTPPLHPRRASLPLLGCSQQYERHSPRRLQAHHVDVRPPDIPCPVCFLRRLLLLRTPRRNVYQPILLQSRHHSRSCPLCRRHNALLSCRRDRFLRVLPLRNLRDGCRLLNTRDHRQPLYPLHGRSQVCHPSP